MRGCENGPEGPRGEGRGGGGVERSSGRNGTIFGSGRRIVGAGGCGGATGGAAAAGFIGSAGGGGTTGATGATFGGSGAISTGLATTTGGSGTISAGAAGFGLTIVAAGRTSASSTASATVPLRVRVAGLAGAPSALATRGLAARLGLAVSSGSSRPLPSFTRSSLASV